MKTQVSIIVIAALIITLSGCGGNTKTKINSFPDTKKEVKTTITPTKESAPSVAENDNTDINYEPDKNDKSIGPEDLQVSGNNIYIKTYMLYQDVISKLGEPDEKLTSEGPFGDPEITCVFGSDLKLVFFNDTVNDTVSSICILSNKYKTARGLTIGDSVDSLIAKYGPPARIDGDTYKYCYDGEEYEVFFVDVIDKKIVAIRISLSL